MFKKTMIKFINIVNKFLNKLNLLMIKKNLIFNTINKLWISYKQLLKYL